MPKKNLNQSPYSRSKKKFERWKRDGRGKGRKASYKSGLNITEVPSSVKNNRKHSVPGIKAEGRLVQLMSDLELDVFSFFDIAKQVIDIREQFPLDQEVTLAIAEKLKIPHPKVKNSGTDEYIANWMTTDLLIDYIDTDGSEKVLAVCIKPASELTENNLKKIKIEYAYWLLKGIRFCVITDRCIPEEVRKNLSFVISFYEDDLNIMEMHSDLAKIEVLVINALQKQDDELHVLCRNIDIKHDLETGTAINVLYYLIATRKVDVDLSVLSIGPKTHSSFLRKYIKS